MGYRLNLLEEPVFMAVPKPMLTEFGIHYRLESCDSQSRFAVFEVVLGLKGPSAAYLMVSLFLCSSGSSARGEARTLQGGRVTAQKALQGSKAETRELLGGTKENRVSRLAVIDLPSRQINDFVPKGNGNKLS